MLDDNQIKETVEVFLRDFANSYFREDFESRAVLFANEVDTNLRSKSGEKPTKRDDVIERFQEIAKHREWQNTGFGKPVAERNEDGTIKVKVIAIIDFADIEGQQQPTHVLELDIDLNDEGQVTRLEASPIKTKSQIDETLVL